MYGGGGEFTRNINAAGGDGTAEYAAEAIKEYCKEQLHKVYDSEGHVAATHEEIDDEGQTVTWEHMQPAYEMYKIRTTKAPSKGDKYGFFAQDEVEYEVHVENTGNIALTMDVTDQFTQNPEYFTVPKLKDVKFESRASERMRIHLQSKKTDNHPVTAYMAMSFDRLMVLFCRNTGGS